MKFLQVATVTLTHAGKLNAIGTNMWRELKQAFNILSSEQSTIRCIVVRGADGNFAAGADIAEFPVEHGDTATVSGGVYQVYRVKKSLLNVHYVPLAFNRLQVAYHQVRSGLPRFQE